MQTEVTNKTLGNILRVMISKKTRDWDDKLCHVEFAYNASPNSAITFSFFQCFYGVNPLLPFSLVDLPTQVPYGDAIQHADAMFRIRVQVINDIVQANQRYKAKADKVLQGHKTFNLEVGCIS